FHSDDGRTNEGEEFTGVDCRRNTVAEFQLSASRHRVGGVAGVVESILVVLSTARIVDRGSFLQAWEQRYQEVIQSDYRGSLAGLTGSKTTFSRGYRETDGLAPLLN